MPDLKVAIESRDMQALIESDPVVALKALNTALQRILAEREEELTTLKEVLAQKDTEIASLKEQLGAPNSAGLQATNTGS
tara:strand:- start:149 stop:388 length:240 start_codon:yes stop_codon:yes gene_type:complete